jgi:hypothetical protein
VSSAKYELGFYIPEDDILHSHRRENSNLDNFDFRENNYSNNRSSFRDMYSHLHVDSMRRPVGSARHGWRMASSGCAALHIAHSFCKICARVVAEFNSGQMQSHFVRAGGGGATEDVCQIMLARIWSLPHKCISYLNRITLGNKAKQTLEEPET